MVYVCGYISWKSKPGFLAVSIVDVFQEALIKLRSICRRAPGAIKTQIIRMNVEQCQSAMLGHPIKFLYPSVNPRLLKQKKKSGILGQRIREFDVAGSVSSIYPEGENRVHAVWLRFKRVSIEAGCVVMNVEIT